MTTSEALFAAARALRETTVRQVFEGPGDEEYGTGCATAAVSRFSGEILSIVQRVVRGKCCPKCGETGGWGLTLLAHLNDTHRLSFSAIAEYLEVLAVEQIHE